MMGEDDVRCVEISRETLTSLDAAAREGETPDETLSRLLDVDDTPDRPN